MSDRLAELRSQRALVGQHLEWLDREIALAEREQVKSLRSAAPTDNPASLRGPSNPPLPEVDILLAAQADAPAKSATDVKRGCYTVFGLMLLLLGLAVTGLYFYSRSRH